MCRTQTNEINVTLDAGFASTLGLSIAITNIFCQISGISKAVIACGEKSGIFYPQHIMNFLGNIVGVYNFLVFKSFIAEKKNSICEWCT